MDEENGMSFPDDVASLSQPVAAHATMVTAIMRVIATITAFVSPLAAVPGSDSPSGSRRLRISVTYSSGVSGWCPRDPNTSDPAGQVSVDVRATPFSSMTAPKPEQVLDPPCTTIAVDRVSDWQTPPRPRPKGDSV